MVENRHFSTEFRFDQESDTLVGLAIVFNSESRDLGGFTETIAPDALSRSNMENVVALYNHDNNFVLGRSSEESNTLTLAVTERGLEARIQLPKTSYGNDIRELVARGDLNEMSFAFRLAAGGDVWEARDGSYHRTINDISEITDVSIVTKAAYAETEVALRSLNTYKENEAAKLKAEEQKLNANDEADREMRNLELELQLLRLKSVH